MSSPAALSDFSLLSLSAMSCGSNLLSFLETITSLVDAKENDDAIYLDLAKAFDKVPHKRSAQTGGSWYWWSRLQLD